MRPIALVIISITIAGSAIAQDRTQTYVSPGVKMAYHWGEGMSAGLEVSVSIRPESNFGAAYGACLNLDLLRDGGLKLHLGLQGGQALGVQLGPTLVKQKSRPLEWGYSATVYGLVTLMPYYTYTNLFGRTMNESGLLIKLPFQVDGPPIGDVFKT